MAFNVVDPDSAGEIARPPCVAAVFHACADGTAAQARPYSLSMKAAVVTRYGPPEVFEIRDVPAPVPRDAFRAVRFERSSAARFQ